MVADVTYSGNASVVDGTDLAAGSGLVDVIGGVYNDAIADVVVGGAGAARLTAARAIHVNLRDASGSEVSPTVSASAATTANVASAATTVTLQAANTSRLGLTIHNDSTQTLYVKLGSGATATSYTVEMAAGAYFEMPYGYTGIVTGIWASANGSARMTELT